MEELDVEAREFLQEFQGQPEDVRRVVIYVICQTMVQTGTLQFMGAFKDIGLGTTLIYKNSETDDVFEILKPDVSEEEEQAIKAHIRELLQENAQAA
ncbi:MAG: hypothetical protein ABFD54_15235 [Armatimonadota bacterium]